MLRSTIHLPPIEEGEFLLCYVKNRIKNGLHLCGEAIGISKSNEYLLERA